MILFIDNYDSFTYNIVQYLQVLQQEVQIYKNDQISLDSIHRLNPDAIIIGPGPCYPEQAGTSLQLIQEFAGKIPMLGICLGHQAIGQAFGGQVIRATQVMHGRVSSIYHKHEGIFNDIPSPLNVTRYHSLVLDKDSLPDCLRVTAWTQDKDSNAPDEIMAIAHKSLAIEGVQFHPESILSEYGYQLLNNFLLAHNLSHINNKQLPISSP